MYPGDNKNYLVLYPKSIELGRNNMSICKFFGVMGLQSIGPLEKWAVPSMSTQKKDAQTDSGQTDLCK